jgi:hypothetical protein
MFTGNTPVLLVLTIVALAIVIRETTSQTPDCWGRIWVTRAAILTIVVWFAAGLAREIATRGLFGAVISRTFGRGILAVVLVWLAFRDEF